LNEKNYIIEHSVKFSQNEINDARETAIYSSYEFDKSNVHPEGLKFFEQYSDANSFYISRDDAVNRKKYYVGLEGELRSISIYNNNTIKYNIYKQYGQTLYIVYNCTEKFIKYGIPVSRHLMLGGRADVVDEFIVRASNKRNIQIANWINANKERFVTWIGLTPTTMTIYYI
jgi:hypothetical protein